MLNRFLPAAGVVLFAAHSARAQPAPSAAPPTAGPSAPAPTAPASAPSAQTPPPSGQPAPETPAPAAVAPTAPTEPAPQPAAVAPSATPSHSPEASPVPLVAPPPVPADAGSRCGLEPCPGEGAVRRGFYFGASVGPGLIFARNDSSDDARTFFGTTVAVQIAMGGRIGKGIVFGGAYFRDQGLTLSTEDEVIDGDEPQLEDTTFSLDRLGPFLEVYPDPDGGLHFQALLAWGDFNMHRPDGIEADDPSGLFVSLAGGYEWFVDEQWRLGALARLTYAPLNVSETSFGTKTSVDLFSPSLLLTATYH